ncbi:MAG TPA: HAD family hydrolase, partial [Candidatus Limnocylindria bacterium]|nr:HAD family hydrolase [Candidatus Limnocylindria bacterium]
MPIAAVLFDLDNTLILEDASTFRALETAARVAAPGVDPKALADAAAKRAATLFEEAPVGAFGARFGIWWGEALWGGFAGDAPELRSLREYVPGYRRQVWHDALASLGASDGAIAD